ncbi:MAG: hypothetical protein HYT16_02650 [DPANN group archaeon]|nr:hypothetical protein [DPANN group archaeon]
MEKKEQVRIPRQMEVVPQEAEEAKALETATEDRSLMVSRSKVIAVASFAAWLIVWLFATLYAQFQYALQIGLAVGVVMLIIVLTLKARKLL